MEEEMKRESEAMGRIDRIGEILEQIEEKLNPILRSTPPTEKDAMELESPLLMGLTSLIIKAEKLREKIDL